MKTIFVLLIALIIIAIGAGIVVVTRQGTEPCVAYYTKDGTRQLNKDCK